MKTEELLIIVKSTNAAIIAIIESKLYESVLEPDIRINDCKILRCDRNRCGGGAARYVTKDLGFSIISVYPHEIESVFFEILLPTSKPMTVGTIYHPPNNFNFLEKLNENMNKIDSTSNEIYILGNLALLCL